MSETGNSADGKARKSWETPELRKVDLTPQEREELLASDDPEASLKKLWPGIKSRQSGPA